MNPETETIKHLRADLDRLTRELATERKLHAGDHEILKAVTGLQGAHMMKPPQAKDWAERNLASLERERAQQEEIGRLRNGIEGFTDQICERLDTAQGTNCRDAWGDKPSEYCIPCYARSLLAAGHGATVNLTKDGLPCPGTCLEQAGEVEELRESRARLEKLAEIAQECIDRQDAVIDLNVAARDEYWAEVERLRARMGGLSKILYDMTLDCGCDLVVDEHVDTIISECPEMDTEPVDRPADVKAIVEQYLKAHGFDGLFSEDECACTLDDLAPCGDMFRDCSAGHIGICDCGYHDFHIGPRQ